MDTPVVFGWYTVLVVVLVVVVAVVFILKVDKLILEEILDIVIYNIKYFIFEKKTQEKSKIDQKIIWTKILNIS
jgi:hypothetical protein